MNWSGYDSATSWLVSVYCSIIFTMNLIPFRLIGLMFVSFMEYYETDRETASIPIVMYTVVTCLLNPFAGMVGQRVGIENMVIVGNFLSAAGIAGCYLARDIIGVSFFLGLLYAIGLSCSNPFLASIIKKHFTRNFTTANGIIFSGSSFVGIIVPPITYVLLDSYRVNGTFLIMGGIMLHSVPIALLIIYASKRQAYIQKLRNTQQKGEKETSKLIQCTETNPDVQSKTKTENSAVKADGSNAFNVEYRTNSTENKEGDNLLQDINEVISYEGSGSAGIVNAEERDELSELTNFRPLPPGKDNKEHSKHFIVSVSTVKENPFTIDEKISLPKKSNPKSKKKLFNFDAFKEANYFLHMAIVGIHGYVCFLNWTTLLDYSRDKYIARTYEKYFLMFHPLSGIVGRLCFGWVVDKKYVSQKTYLIACLLLMALSSICMIFAHNIEFMMTGVLIFGACAGTSVTLFPGLIYQFVKEENQTVAQASQYTLFGIMIFTTTPLIGYFRENRGSYDGLYYLIAAMCLLCCILLPLLFKQRKPTKELFLHH